MSAEAKKAIIRRRKVTSTRRRDGLLQHAFNVTSQGGEDNSSYSSNLGQGMFIAMVQHVLMMLSDASH
ncbi:MAG: hypothetical protein ACREBR_03225 [bacterium]